MSMYQCYLQNEEMSLKMKYLIVSFPYPFTQMKQQCLFGVSVLSKAVLHKGLEGLTFYLGNTLQEC